MPPDPIQREPLADPLQAKRPSKRRSRWLSARGRSLEITKSGWLFIGLTLLVGFAAINSGSNLLHAVFGAMMALIVGSGVLSESTVRRSYARRFVAGPVHAGTPAPLAVEVRAVDERDVLAVSIEDDEANPDDGGRCDPAFAVRVEAGDAIRLQARVLMPRRGPARLPAAVVVTRFPFGLFIKRRALPEPAEIIVYPHVRSMSDAELGAPASGENAGTQQRARAGEFFGLREFREGDDARRIHWPASTRLARPVVREMETGGLPECVLAMPSGTAGTPDFETAVETAASVAVGWLERGARVALTEQGRTVVPPGEGSAHRRRVLETLAMAGFGPSDLARLPEAAS